MIRSQIFPVLLLVAGQAAAQEPERASPAPPLQRVLGEVTAVDAAAGTLRLKTDATAEVLVTTDAKAGFLRALPGARDLQGATPITLADIAAGDRVLARGALAANGASLTARQVVVMTRKDLTERQDRDQADWARRGISGVVTAIDPATQEITVETRSLAGKETVVVATRQRPAVFRRYAADSVKFGDARNGAFPDVQIGDQLRALGDRESPGGKLLAEQVVSGAFRTVSGAVKSVEAGGGVVTIVDNETQKPLTIVVGPETLVRRIPPPMALRLAARARGEAGGAPGAGGARPQGGPPSGAGAGAPQGGDDVRRRAGGGTLQEMLERLPALAVSEIRLGDQVAVSSTRGKDAARLVAVALIAGIEPLLESRPRGSAGGDAGPGLGLPPGALDLGFGAQ